MISSEELAKALGIDTKSESTLKAIRELKDSIGIYSAREQVYDTLILDRIKELVDKLNYVCANNDILFNEFVKNRNDTV